MTNNNTNPEVWEDPRMEGLLIQLIEMDFIAKRGITGGGMTEWHIMEMFQVAQSSFWYIQLKTWVEKEEFKPIPSVHEGAELLLRVIDSGYTKEHGWFSMKALGLSDAEIRVGTLKIWSFGLLLPVIRTKTMHVVSAWFEHIIGWVTRPDWERKAKKFVRDIQIATLPDEVALQPCINPDCNNEVDRRKRKSGACCKAHINYVCAHPSCVSKAQVKGWKHYTHRYGTKIAEAHMEYRQ